MTNNSTDRQLVWVVLALVAAIIVVPAVGMLGAGSMMGGVWGDHMWGDSGASGWTLVIGVGMQLLFLAVVLGAGYLGYRALTTQAESSDPALEELRAAYARGDLTDDEFERRRDRLETDA